MSDLISREAVMDEIDRIGAEAFSDYQEYSNLFDFIDNLPSDKSLLVKMLQGLKDEIINNSYPIVHGINDYEMGMSLYGICQIIDNKIKECSE